MSSDDGGTSPYLVGAGLGLLNTFAFATAERGIGVTTAFESAAAMTGRRLAPDVTRVNEYLKRSAEVPHLDWETFLVLGTLAGSYLSALASRQRAPARLPAVWVRRFGSNRARRYGASLLGGAVMMFGAPMAKGCTSGHGLTGTMQLALSSWVFTPLMGATAALVGRALYGRGEG